MRTRHKENTCKIDGCARSCWRDLCQLHSRHIRWGLLPAQFGIEANEECIVDGCANASYSKAIPMCQGHHAFAITGKDPGTLRPKARRGQPSKAKPRIAAAKRLPPEARLLQPCQASDCSCRTRTAFCALHTRQFERFGVTWNGKRPADLVATLRAARIAALPSCAIASCASKATTTKSALCASHRTDKRAKHCSLEFYIQLMASDTCQSCGRGDIRLVIDHDHAHDWAHAKRDSMCELCIRGRICNSCNTALGFLGDDVTRIRALASYLLAN